MRNFRSNNNFDHLLMPPAATTTSGAADVHGLELEQLLPVEDLPEDAEAAVALPLVILHPRHDGGRLRYGVVAGLGAGAGSRRRQVESDGSWG